jgi:Flp pilus assembly pilin Flp
MRRNRRGATSIEYALIATVVSIGIIAGVSLFATSVSDLWFHTASTVTQNM